jgi:hypothetical protein
MPVFLISSQAGREEIATERITLDPVILARIVMPESAGGRRFASVVLGSAAGPGQVVHRSEDFEHFRQELLVDRLVDAADIPLHVLRVGGTHERRAMSGLATANWIASFSMLVPRARQCAAALRPNCFSSIGAGCQGGVPRSESNPIPSGDALITPISCCLRNGSKSSSAVSFSS